MSENEKLPSLRTLAKSLSLSLTTVTSAYEQLEVEGYIYSKPQSGYYIRSVRIIGLAAPTEQMQIFRQVKVHPATIALAPKVIAART